MEITYFTDILFDLINECDAFPIEGIESDDKAHSFKIFMEDGSAFSVECRQISPRNRQLADIIIFKPRV